MNKLNLITVLSIITCLIFTSCQKDNELNEVSDKVSLQNVDKDYFKTIEEEYIATDKSALTKSYATFHNTVSDIKRFETSEDFELAAAIVNMKAELSNGKIPVHESLKNLDFDYATPDLASFFNHEGKLIVENTLYEIISKTEQNETNLLTNEVTTTSIVDFEESTSKDDPTYEYKIVSWQKPSTSSSSIGSFETLTNYADYYINVGSWEEVPSLPNYSTVIKFEVECMQRVWKSWTVRLGRAETNITKLYYSENGFENADYSHVGNTGDFCFEPFIFFRLKSEVFNPRDNGDGEGCDTSRATCKRKRNTGVTSRHYVYKDGEEYMNFYRN